MIAFDRLARELVAHGAPASLVRAARRAQRDEVRHARLMRRLAERLGVQVCGPEAKRLPVRPLAEVARENAVEGCVGETYGAVAGLLAASRAPDPEVRAVMQSIARDECRHAQLSWRVAAWAAGVLGDRDLEGVRQAMRKAVAELVAGEDGLPATHRALTGLPSAEERRRAVHLLDEALFRAA